ncbi:MAG: phage protease [Kiritimatiellia bacterium]|jgi:phage I-like protein
MKRKPPSQREQRKAPAAAVCIVTPAALAADGDGKLPTRMKILNWGPNPNSQGRRVVVGRALLERMADPTYAFRTIALDYEHNTCKLSAAYKESQEPRPVAAFGSVDVVEGEGVFVDVERWTPSGLANACNYCDLSATPLLDAEGNVTAVVSVALTRAGAVPGITFSQAALAALAAMEADNPNEEDNEEDNQMNWKEKLAKLLGLTPDRPDDELEAALQARLDNADKQKQQQKQPDPKPEAPSPAPLSAEEVGRIVSTAVQAVAAPLAARLDAQEKQKIIDDARGDGKIVALGADLLGKLTPAELKAHCDALPRAVPLAPLTPVKVDEGTTVALSATEVEVCAALGITAEQYAREKGKGAK